MRKSKGIIIELTALLDVIFIMLFWVMINVQESSTRVMEDADSRIAQAEAQVEEIRRETEDQLESMREQTDSEIAAAKEQAENIDKNAAANQQALDNYGDGMMLTLNLKYETGGQLAIFNGDDELGSAALSSEDGIYSSIISALEEAKIGREDVVLCAFVYDGSVALYRDVSSVSGAVERVGRSYENFYCTYINTAR